RFLCGANPKNRCDWTENFFAKRWRISWNINKHGWLVKKSQTSDPISASQNLCTHRDRFLHLVINAFQNVFVCQWTNLGRFIDRIADFERSHLINELISKLVLHDVGNEKSVRGYARLTAGDCSGV